ncbi:MAG: RNA 2',3'-cyclic phosphodiesterase [Guyparkeria sp.]|uniref:RNA 2',3'-cyclic phosphodiesterase n=1 Tax=Guyparkeria sp. TaxID=2035736 RepID=UPI00397AACD1
MTGRKRVFVALWPDEEIRASLHRLVRGLDVGGRAVPREHLHLTLAFPGTIEAHAADCLAERVASLRVGPIPILLDRLGHFPGARVAWVGPSHVPPALARLAAEARGLCLSCGAPSDDRPFVPHVTLRRFARPPVAPTPETPIHWFADTAVLVESGRDGHPGPYRLLARSH